VVARAADPGPPGARQPIAERAEAREDAEVEQGDVQQREDAHRGAFLSARDQRRKQELDEQEEGNEDREHDQETDEHFLAGTRPFEAVVDDVRARPKIAPLPRRRPEAVDPERNDGQQRVGCRNREIFPPISGEADRAAAAGRRRCRRIHGNTPVVPRARRKLQ
jgi:hypothetical protein